MAPTVQTEVQGVPARPRLRQPSRNSSNVCGPGGRGAKAVSAPLCGASHDKCSCVASSTLAACHAAPCARGGPTARTKPASRSHDRKSTRSAACGAPSGRVRTGAGVLQQLGFARAETSEAARPPREHQAVCRHRSLSGTEAVADLTCRLSLVLSVLPHTNHSARNARKQVFATSDVVTKARKRPSPCPGRKSSCLPLAHALVSVANLSMATCMRAKLQCRGPRVATSLVV